MVKRRGTDQAVDSNKKLSDLLKENEQDEAKKDENKTDTTGKISNKKFKGETRSEKQEMSALTSSDCPTTILSNVKDRK